MLKLAKSQNIELIDMHKVMTSQYDDGDIWWDQVHLTPFGHYIFAQNMIEHLKEIL